MLQQLSSSRLAVQVEGVADSFSRGLMASSLPVISSPRLRAILSRSAPSPRPASLASSFTPTSPKEGLGAGSVGEGGVKEGYNLSPLGIWEDLHLPGVKGQVQKSVRFFGGVYCIINLVNGNMYVGSGVMGNIGTRFHKHLYAGIGSRLVWAAVKKYGLHNFAFVLLDTVPPSSYACAAAGSVNTPASSLTKAVASPEGRLGLEDNSELLALEDKYILMLAPKYNIAPKAGNTFGVLHTEDTKQHLRAVYSTERREMIGSLNRGKNLSASTKELIRAASLNRPPMTEETRALVSSKSSVALLLSVSRVDGGSFLSPEGQTVSEVVLRTIPVLAKFIGCNERTVRRALKANNIVKSTWKVVSLGTALSSPPSLPPAPPALPQPS